MVCWTQAALPPFDSSWWRRVGIANHSLPPKTDPLPKITTFQNGHGILDNAFSKHCLAEKEGGFWPTVYWQDKQLQDLQACIYFSLGKSSACSGFLSSLRTRSKHMRLQTTFSGTENTAFVLRLSLPGLVNRYKSISHKEEFSGPFHLC